MNIRFSSDVPARERPGLTGYWRTLQLTSIGLSVVVLVVMWVLTWQRLTAEAELLENNVQLQQRSLAAIVSENLAQVVDRGKLMAITAGYWFDGDRHDAGDRLATMLATDHAFLRLEIYDSAFRRVYSSSPVAGSKDMTEALRAMARQSRGPDIAMDEVFIGPRLKEEAWHVPVMVPISGGVRRPDGYLLVMVDMGYFLTLYRNIDIGRSGAIHILTSDGMEIAEARPEGFSLNAAPRRLAQFVSTGVDDGHVRGQLYDSRGDYLSSYRKVERTPFVVVVSRGLDEIRASHASNSARVWIALAILSLIFVGAAWSLVRSIRRQKLLFYALSDADRDKHTLIVQLEAEKARAMALASDDHLTGLHNRRMFNELAASHLEVARRSRKHYALMYLDLDRFKLINDTLGHHVGDLLLQAVAGRLRANVRKSDIVGRMGGDEFAVLVTELDSTGDMDAIAVKLVRQISQPYPDLDGHEVQVTPSIGIAFFPRDGHDVTTLCRHADAAMYESKRYGRGRFTYYDAALNPAGDRLYTLERQLPRAIEDGELVLHFQPKVRLTDYRIVGLEALVRWQHPEYGLVYPNDFIPLAEQSGLIVELGNWVMQACCAQQAAWRAQGVDVVPVAFNVSPLQLRDESLPARVARLLSEYGLSASDLEIEVTESCLVEPVGVAAKVLTELEALGVRIGLDDFGSGFSSLSQIRDFPINTLKIDRSFINNIRSSKDVGVIVTSIITLAHNLSMRVVAEGVELRDQLVYLKTAGCDEVQGYYMSRPVNVSDTARLLAQATIIPA